MTIKVTTESEIARLRELLAKATVGEWFVGSREHMVGSGPTHLIAYDPAWGAMNNGRATPGIIATGNPNDIADTAANIALIAAMKNALPALLDAAASAEPLRRALEAARGVLRDYICAAGEIDASDDALLDQIDSALARTALGYPVSGGGDE